MAEAHEIRGSSTRCLVLGGGGFIGTNLCRALAERGIPVTVFGHPPSFPEAVRGIPWKTGEFDDTKALGAASDGADIVVHLIGATTPGSAEESAIRDLRLNVEPTLSLLELARAGRVGRIVFVSSGGTVYGVPRSLPIPETAPTDPICAYGVGKLTIEKYLHLYGHLHGVAYRVLRPSNAYGPFQTGRKGQGVVPVILKAGLGGGAFEMWGDGSVVRDYVAVGDVVDALLKAMAHEGAERVFNIGSGVGTSLVELLATTEAVLGKRIACRKLPGRPIDVPANVLDVTRARERLGWRPTIPLTAGLALAEDWLKSELGL